VACVFVSFTTTRLVFAVAVECDAAGVTVTAAEVSGIQSSRGAATIPPVSQQGSKHTRCHRTQ
jgi:hypothetical protein